MKILLINKFLYPNGGSETYIFKLGKELLLQGHEVQYFGMEHESRTVGNNVNVYTSNMDFHNASFFEKLTYPLKTIYSTESRKKIRLVLNDFKPDIVHLNNFNYQLTPSIILEIKKWSKKNNKEIRIVFTAHDLQLVCPNHMMINPNTKKKCEKCLGGNFIHCTKGKCIHNSISKSIIGTIEAMFWKLKGVYKHIDSIICCSDFMKTKMDTNPLFASKTIAMHNFIDNGVYQGVKKNYILYFGRFSEEKGINTLLKVCEQLPDVKFVFAGSGPLEEKAAHITNIENVGFQQGDRLKKLIQEALFTILPSEVFENCPFSVMESLVYGTPVLGANIGGIPELIDEYKTGELFESGNVEDLKSKVLNLWRDKIKLDEYAKNCKNVHFDTIKQYYDKLLRIYEGDLDEEA